MSDLDNVYRALGRYVVAFSSLNSWMRHEMAARLARKGELHHMIVSHGETNSYPLSNAFFTTCKEIGELEKDEKGIANALRAQVGAILEDRNNLMHGDWAFAHPDRPDELMALARFKPSRITKPALSMEKYGAKRLDKMTDELEATTRLVAEFGALALRQFGFKDSDHRVRDLFELGKKGLVTRSGARAAETPFLNVPPSNA